MGMAMGDMYAVNAASAHASPSITNAAPDARQVGSTTPTGATQPAWTWVAMVLTLVFIRYLEEMAN